jgi:hypothetical protein
MCPESRRHLLSVSAPESRVICIFLQILVQSRLKGDIAGRGDRPYGQIVATVQRILRVNFLRVRTIVHGSE